MVKKGARYTVTVENWASDGGGVARVDGMAVFVKGGIVGERCVIEVEHVGHRAAWAHIAELLEPSPARMKPDCPHYGVCGGCQLQHMDYKTELRFKADKIAQALERIGGIHVEGLQVKGDDRVYYYRNKAQYPIGPNGAIGFYRQRSHEVVDAPHCLLLHSGMDEIRQAVKDWMDKFSVPAYDERTKTGLLRHLYLRSEGNGHMLCVLVVNGDSVPHEKELVERVRRAYWLRVDGILLNTNTKDTNVVLGEKNRLLWGQEYLEDGICSITVRLSPHSFYQVNRSQAQSLYWRVGELAALTKQETLLDLYCGTGTIGLTMAEQCRELIGVEVIPQAIQDAKVNAWRNDIENATFLCADAEKAADMLASDDFSPDVIVVDPPRKGLTPVTIGAILRMEPKRIIYVSCDPATLARDLKLLCRETYEPTAIEGFDLFPRTEHVETVVKLERK